jgi:hypothetical protein
LTAGHSLLAEVRDAYSRLVEQGWTDALRALHPGERIYILEAFSERLCSRCRSAHRSSSAMQTVPLCPITGLPSKQCIQPISLRLISGLWRRGFGVATGQRLADIERFGLWESPCRLAFFEPMLEGDEAFYRELCLGA